MLRVARDKMQEELSKRPPPPSPTSPEQPDTAQTLSPLFFHARMHSPGSVSSLDALAMDEEDNEETPVGSPFVDEVAALRAEKAALQQMVRKMHNDIEVERAENRRDRKAVVEWEAKRDAFERELAEFVAQGFPLTPRTLPDTAAEPQEKALPQARRFSLRKLCRSLSGRSEVALA